MFDNIINNDKNKIDTKFDEESKKVLNGMTEGTINNFT